MTYPQKFRHLNEPYPSEEVLLEALESLNAPEWRSFLDDLFRAKPQAVYWVRVNRDVDPVLLTRGLLRRLGQHTQRLVQDALEQLISNYRRMIAADRRPEDIDVLTEALKFAALSPEGVDENDLVEIALDDDYDVDLRIEAARTLANHPQRAPDWFLNLDPAEHPHLAAPLVAVLTERRGPLEALESLQQLKAEPPYLESSVRLAVEMVQRSDAGLSRLGELYHEAPSWFQDFIDRLIELPELAEARRRLTGDRQSPNLVPYEVPQKEPAKLVPYGAPQNVISPGVHFQVDLRRWLPWTDQEILNFFEQRLDGLNGHDPRDGVQNYESRESGRLLGKWVTTHPILRQDRKSVKRFFWLGLRASQEHTQARRCLFGPHMLRAACENRLGKDAEVPSRTDVCSALGQLTHGNLLQHARRLGDAIKNLGIRRKLRIGVSEFHEDRIYTGLLNLLLDELNVPVPELVDCSWSNFGIRDKGMQEADVVFMFESDAKEHMVPYSRRLYSFKGHYILVRREVVEAIAGGDRGDSEAQESAGILLKEEQEFNSVQAEQRLRIAVACGVPTTWRASPGILYQGLTQRLAAYCKRHDIEPEPQNGQQLPESHAHAFEQFVAGEAPWFVGGAIYARTLNRWWASPKAGAYVVQVVDPSHLEEVFGTDWHLSNVVALNPRLRTEAVEQSVVDDLQQNLFGVCENVSKLLYELVGRYGGKARSEADKKVLDWVYDALLPKTDEENGPARHSFVADEEDVQHLLQKDNDFSDRAGSGA